MRGPGAQATMQGATAHRILARSRRRQRALSGRGFPMWKTLPARGGDTCLFFAVILPWVRMRAGSNRTERRHLDGDRCGSASPCSRSRKGKESSL